MTESQIRTNPDAPRVNEMFSFRDGERVVLHRRMPDEGACLAAMLCSVHAPGNAEGAVITTVVCQRRGEDWKPLILTVPSKLWLLDTMFSTWRCDPDQWYYFTLEK